MVGDRVGTTVGARVGRGVVGSIVGITVLTVGSIVRLIVALDAGETVGPRLDKDGTALLVGSIGGLEAGNATGMAVGAVFSGVCDAGDESLGITEGEMSGVVFSPLSCIGDWVEASTIDVNVGVGVDAPVNSWPSVGVSGRSDSSPISVSAPNASVGAVVLSRSTDTTKSASRLIEASMEVVVFSSILVVDLSSFNTKCKAS